MYYPSPYLRVLALFSLCAVVSSTCRTSSAETYSLYTQGQPTADYDQIVGRLQPGDQISFSNGKSFTIGTLIKNGVNTKVLSILEDSESLLRIALRTEKAFRMKYYRRGHAILSRYGVPVVRIRKWRSSGSEYMLVEKIPIHFTLEDLIHQRTYGGGAIEEQEADRAWAALPDFAEKTWEFEEIGDFKDNLPAWDGSRWVLYDFDADHDLYSVWRPSDFHIFSYISFSLPSDIARQIQERIDQRRRRLESKYRRSRPYQAYWSLRYMCGSYFSRSPRFGP